MRIGLNGLPLLSPLTGIGHYTRNLVLELAASGYCDVRLFYGVRWSGEIRSGPLGNIEGAKSAIKAWLPRPYLVARAVQETVFAATTPDQRLDVYHDTTGFPLRFGGPIVTTIHDLAWRRFPQTHPAQRVQAYERWISSSVRRTAHFVTGSHAIEREIVDLLQVPPAKVTTVPIAARRVFAPRDEAHCLRTLNRHGLQYRRFLLCVGTLEPRKNVIAALTAFSRMPGVDQERWPLVLVGMRGWLTAGIDDRLSPLLQSGRVRALGYLDEDDLAALYASARMLIYPSLYEGFGLPPLEAMASGTPVIVSNASSLPEVVGDAGIQVDPHDVDALRSAVNRLAEDDALWEALRSSGLARAAQFSWRRCAEQTLAVYRQVAGRAAG